MRPSLRTLLAVALFALVAAPALRASAIPDGREAVGGLTPTYTLGEASALK